MAEKTTPTVIAVASRKGGVGKTTVALGMGMYLAKKAKVALIDFDIQGSSFGGIFNYQTNMVKSNLEFQQNLKEADNPIHKNIKIKLNSLDIEQEKDMLKLEYKIKKLLDSDELEIYEDTIIKSLYLKGSTLSDWLDVDLWKPDQGFEIIITDKEFRENLKGRRVPTSIISKLESLKIDKIPTTYDLKEKASVLLSKKESEEYIGNILNSTRPKKSTSDIEKMLYRPKIENYNHFLSVILLAKGNEHFRKLNSMFYSQDGMEWITDYLIDLIYELSNLGFEYIIFDCTPGLYWSTALLFSIFSALKARTIPIFMTTPSVSDVGGVFYELELLEKLFLECDNSFWICNFLKINSEEEKDNGVYWNGYQSVGAIREKLLEMPQFEELRHSINVIGRKTVGRTILKYIPLPNDQEFIQTMFYFKRNNTLFNIDAFEKCKFGKQLTLFIEKNIK